MDELEEFKEKQKEKSKEVVVDRLIAEVKKVETKQGYVFFKEQEDVRK